MEILSAILDIFLVLDSKNIFIKKWEIFRDSNGYFGTRLFAFISVLILIIIYLGLLSLIIFLIYSYFNEEKI